MSVAVSHHHINHHIFGWKSYRLLKKKAMAQELSWTGLIINLSIAFFIVIACAMLMHLAYDAAIKSSVPSPKRIESAVALARAVISVDTADAMAPDYLATATTTTTNIRLVPGQQVTDSITYTNIGAKAWLPFDVSFETGSFLKIASQFQTSSWLDSSRPAKLPKIIMPGQSVTLSFGLKAPFDANGSTDQDFQLVYNSRGMDGSRVRQSISVKPFAVPASPALASAKLRTAAPKKKALESAQSKSSNDYCIATIPPSPTSDCNTDRNEGIIGNGIGSNIILNSEPTIRVGLFSTLNAQRLTADQSYKIYGGSDLLADDQPANSIITVSFDAAARQYAVNGNNLNLFTRKPIRLVPRSGGVVTVLDYRRGQKPQDNRFRNIVEYRYSEGDKTVWLINELLLDDYIKGLGETTNASPVEFQKVMATVSRTYALYHYLRGVSNDITDASTKHAAQHFHVDSVYDQVYRGYNSELRLTGLQAAVEATRGAVVTYNNKPVVTPYFSNSDGRTRSFQEVWGGAGMPWLVSVAVPEDAGKTLYGHGVGMSARGALLMVSSGSSWKQALEYFYTGTSVLKVY